MLTPIATPHTYLPWIPEVLGFSGQLRVYVKEESYQYGRSVKGRVAYAMACQSQRSGRRIIESPSGNLALGLAFWCEPLGCLSRCAWSMIVARLPCERLSPMLAA